MEPSGPSRPRLCVAMLVRGAPPATLDSFCRYHLGIGFSAIHFFFDAPDDPKERDALRVCESWTTKVRVEGSAHRTRCAVVHRCDAAWWRDEEASGRNRLFAHGRDYAAAEEAPPMGGPFGLVRSAPNPLQKAARDAVKWHEEVRDVQARQQLVIDRAAKRVRRWPTSKAPISVVFHSFRLIFRRAIISRSDLERERPFLVERARADRSR